MRLRSALLMSLLSSLSVGIAVHKIHAQAKPPVYMVAINEVSNQDGYSKQYLPLAQKSIKDHGGVYVAAGPGTIIDGTPPNGRVVILRWESMEALSGWRNSPEYVAARKIGESFARYNILSVNGIAQ